MSIPAIPAISTVRLFYGALDPANPIHTGAVVSVTWGAVAGATEYRIRQLGTADNDVVVPAPSTAGRFVAALPSGYAIGQAIALQVRAENADGQSDWLSFSTGLPVTPAGASNVRVDFESDVFSVVGGALYDQDTITLMWDQDPDFFPGDDTQITLENLTAGDGLQVAKPSVGGTVTATALPFGLGATPYPFYRLRVTQRASVPGISAGAIVFGTGLPVTTMIDFQPHAANNPLLKFSHRTSAAPNATQWTMYSWGVTAPIGAVITVTGLPAWAQVSTYTNDMASGLLISGQAITAGVSNLTITATLGTNVDTRNLTLTVVAAAYAYPVTLAGTPAAGSIYEGGNYDLVVTGNNLGWCEVSGQPTWMHAQGLLLFGTPPAGSAGVYVFTLSGKNVGSSASISFTLTVLPLPSLTSPLAPTATQGQFFSFPIVTVNATTRAWASLPSWIAWDGTSIAGTVPLTAATQNLTLALTSGGGTVNVPFTLTIYPSVTFDLVTDPDTGAYVQGAGAVCGAAFVFDLHPQNATSLTVPTLPPWLSWDGRYLRGTPTSTGTDVLAFAGTNVGGVVTSATLTIYRGVGNVDIPAMDYVSSDGYPAGRVGVPMSWPVITSMVAATLAMGSGSPSWMQIVGGALTGTPPASGSFDATVVGTNAYGIASANFHMTVAAQQVTCALSASVRSGGTFSLPLTSDSPYTLTWTVALPDGLTGLAVSGSTLSGTPATTVDLPHTFDIPITGTNDHGTANATLELTLKPPTPRWTSGTSVSGLIGQLFSATLAAVDAVSYSVASGQSLPGGLTLTGAVVSGIPTSCGVSTLTFLATNSAGSESQALTITVAAISSPTTSTAVVGQQWSYLAQSGATGAQWSIVAAPDGFHFGPSQQVIGTTVITLPNPDNVLVGTFSATGVQDVSIRCLDPASGYTQMLTITVQVSAAGAASGAGSANIGVPVTVDMDSRAVTSSASSSAGSAASDTPVIVAKQGDNLIVALQIAKGGLPADLALSSLNLALKTDIDGDIIAQSSAWLKTGSGSETCYFVCISLTGAGISDSIEGSATNAYAEIVWTYPSPISVGPSIIRMASKTFVLQVGEAILPSA